MAKGLLAAVKQLTQQRDSSGTGRRRSFLQAWPWHRGRLFYPPVFERRWRRGSPSPFCSSVWVSREGKEGRERRVEAGFLLVQLEREEIANERRRKEAKSPVTWRRLPSSLFPLRSIPPSLAQGPHFFILSCCVKPLSACLKVVHTGWQHLARIPSRSPAWRCQRSDLHCNLIQYLQS